ncbi:hypothetical protein [Azoarcus taiwanensis]|uniref:hypothetical protein n=1 Tax=Azoarcus taiwanensis TaxID=666964 RepID=UPI001FE944B1|nr:hypothetical protein [Azoarcus taiwanensis]
MRHAAFACRRGRPRTRSGLTDGPLPGRADHRHGELYPFRPGIARIVERTPVPVVPMALRGLWGSFFSRKNGPAMTRPFRRGVFNRIELVAADAVAAAEVTPQSLQETVAAMRSGRR